MSRRHRARKIALAAFIAAGSTAFSISSSSADEATSSTGTETGQGLPSSQEGQGSSQTSGSSGATSLSSTQEQQSSSTSQEPTTSQESQESTSPNPQSPGPSDLLTLQESASGSSSTDSPQTESSQQDQTGQPQDASSQSNIMPMLMSSPPPQLTNQELIDAAVILVTSQSEILSDISAAVASPSVDSTDAISTAQAQVLTTQSMISAAQVAVSAELSLEQNLSSLQEDLDDAQDATDLAEQNQLVAQLEFNSAQEAVSSQQALVTQTQTDLSNAQSALSVATTDVTAQQQVVTQLQQTLSQAQAELAAASTPVVTVIENYTDGVQDPQITSGAGASISGGWSVEGVQGNALYTNGQSPITINPTAQNVTSISFDIYAKNGDAVENITFTDGTTATGTLENGVMYHNNVSNPDHTYVETIVAPSDKYIDYVVIQPDYDVYIIDNIRYTTPGSPADPSLVTAVSTAQSNLSSAQTLLTSLTATQATTQSNVTLLESTLSSQNTTLSSLQTVLTQKTTALALANSSLLAAQTNEAQASLSIVTAQALLDTASSQADVAVDLMQESLELLQYAVTLADINIDLDLAQIQIDNAQAFIDLNSISTQAQSVVDAAQAALDSSRLIVNNASLTLADAISQNATALTQDQAQDAVDIATLSVASATSTVQLEQSQVSTAQAAVNAAQAAVNSQTTSGVIANIYNNYGYNSAPPLPGQERLITQTTVNNIQFNWGGGLVLDQLAEDVAVKFTSQLTSPVSGTIYFYAPADDGTILQLDGNTVINDWYDKGGGGSVQTYNVTANDPMDMTFWFYENGGGANVTLMWNLNNGAGWTAIPSSAFTQSTASLEQIQALSNANNTLTLELQQLAAAQGALTTAQTSLTSAQTSLQAAQDADALVDDTSTDVTGAINAINVAESYVNTLMADIHATLTPTITQSIAADGTVTLTVTPPVGFDANTWFYQVVTSNPDASNPYENGTWNTDGAPSTFTITGLSNNVTYTVRVAHWNGDVSSYTETVVTPISTQSSVYVPDFSGSEDAADPGTDTEQTEQDTSQDTEEESQENQEEDQSQEEGDSSQEEGESEQDQADGEEPTDTPPSDDSDSDNTSNDEEVNNLDDALADGEVTAGEAESIIEDILADANGELSDAEKEAVAAVLVAAYAENGEAVPADVMAQAGISAADLPPDTPIELSNGVVIVAEVQAAFDVLAAPSELVSAIFENPAQVLTALTNLGADMSEEEREESQKVVVASVIAASIAVQAAAGAAVSAATSAASTSSSSSSSSSGGGAPSGRENGTVKRRRTASKQKPKSKVKAKKAVKKSGRIRRIKLRRKPK